jgi:hypothetical protein
MEESVPTYFVLVSEFGSKISGLLALKIAIEDKLAEISKARWVDEALGQFDNKGRMKQLGGFVSFGRSLLREFCILGMAKVFEDILVSSREMGLREFDIWSGDELGLPYHHQIRCIRNLANVIKHNNSRIVVGGGSACRFLLEKAGFAPGTSLGNMEFDEERSLFQIYVFLVALCGHLTGVKMRIPIDDEAAAFAKFRGGSLPWFLEQTQAPLE